MGQPVPSTRLLDVREFVALFYFRFEPCDGETGVSGVAPRLLFFCLTAQKPFKQLLSSRA